MSKHVPVLLNEVLEVLSPKPGDVAIDATLGAGGHASELLKAVGPKGMLLGIDADKQAAQNFQNSVKAKNAKVAVGNFAEFAQIAKGEGIEKADVILFDFGLSSDQLDNPERGFSFQKDGPLDMRLNTDEQELTAGFIVNKFSEQELTEILRNFGEEPNAKRIARAIVKIRKEEPFQTTGQLFELIKKLLPAKFRFKAGDTARRTFQALRIAVNKELEVIEKGLREAFEILAPGGRMAAISFHSLEDRIVKKYFNELARGCICPPEFPVCKCGHEPSARVLTPKPITAGLRETETNTRSHSAKLRAIGKIDPAP